MNPIAPISTAIRPIEVGGSERAGALQPASGSDFGELLSGAITEARMREQVATKQAVGFANGDTRDPRCHPIQFPGDVERYGRL